MNIHLGVDIGAVGLKAALLVPKDLAETIVGRNGDSAKFRMLTPPKRQDVRVLVVGYTRTRGRPVEATRALLCRVLEYVEASQLGAIAVTGSGSALVADALGAPRCNEFQATARGVDLLHPQVRTVFEIGGETSKYLRLGPDPASGMLGILDYSANGDCAAGTGAFLDQQATRLKYPVEAIGGIVAEAERAAQIAGRCSVFAKSDMIHAQQKGFTPPEVLRGLCNAVATNFKSAIVRGRTPEPPVMLLGGVSANTAVVQALREVFDLDEETLVVPEAAESLAAVGAALVASEIAETDRPNIRESLSRLGVDAATREAAFARSAPLTLDRVTLLRDQVTEYTFPEDGSIIDACLGLDIGSVGTKLVVIDE
ncbi:MAG: hypothetical protein JXA69_01475, partial [Phycisphaerae bacterium]|nr:hypothetical protein [Phycisphaerae bacterium]